MVTLDTMGEFKRSPSKVWWANDNNEVCTSPGSQDSGFSDTETSLNLQTGNSKNAEVTPKKTSAAKKIPKDIFKELTSENSKQNLTANYKEKSTPEKVKLGTQSEIKAPLQRLVELAPNTDPVRKHKYAKNIMKVSKNLFNAKQIECMMESHQYSNEVAEDTRYSFLNTSEEATVDDSYSCHTETPEKVDESYVTQSLPLIKLERYISKLSNSAPANIDNCKEIETDSATNDSLSSDCDSELESLFNGPLESLKYTSTPKTEPEIKMCQRDKVPLNLFLKYQYERNQAALTNRISIDKKAVQKWMEEARQSYEQECMTTLQCKSIAGELNHKVSFIASSVTTTIRDILYQSSCIENGYRNLNGEATDIEPTIQTVIGNICDFFKTHGYEINTANQIVDEIRASKSRTAYALVAKLFNQWENARKRILSDEVKKMVDKLENPTSELELRATVTAITSLALRNNELIQLFIWADIIPILLILCEKCEGSSLRSLILRCLTTMCFNSSAVRHFEKFSGVQIIAETLEERSRPESERSEAVALLAQVTAPWLEDNHSVKGLQDYSRKLVKALTKFASSTKCCQNLLLCTAALTNLSTMDPKCVKYMITMNTVKVILEVVKGRGAMASVYLLEQVATLIANMSASDVARRQLIEANAATLLLYFLKTECLGEDVEKRLQQKSIIALSRLSGEKDAAVEIVEQGGVEKLVRMCREKDERHDSDAVLVAALATLRKIADTCGSEVLNAQDAQELVEPKLLDSFLAYSTQSESYV